MNLSPEERAKQGYEHTEHVCRVLTGDPESPDYELRVELFMELVEMLTGYSERYAQSREGARRWLRQAGYVS